MGQTLPPYVYPGRPKRCGVLALYIRPYGPIHSTGYIAITSTRKEGLGTLGTIPCHLQECRQIQSDRACVAIT